MREEQPLPFATNRARALFAHLAVEANQPHPRESLAALLWPDDLEKSARQNLRQTLARVRQAIGDYDADPAFLQISRATLQINRDAPIELDLLDFQQLLVPPTNHHDHHDRHSTVQCNECMARLATAVELYQGPFLDGLHLADSAPFEEWVLLTRQQAQRQVLNALDTLATFHTSQANHQIAQQYATRQLEIEPWRESAHRQLMISLASTGQRAEALAQYEACRQLLADELAFEPDVQTVQLAEQIRAGEVIGPVRQDGKVTRWQDDKVTVVSPSSTHLVPPSSCHLDPYAILSRLEPLPDQQLFGVEKALAKVETAINASARSWLVSIDGLGGIGKTTLANALVHKILDDRPTDGTPLPATRYQDIGWVSAKQDEYSPDRGVQQTGKPALDAETLMDLLLAQLADGPYPTGSSHEKRMALTQLLKEKVSLVVVDNLETAVDYEAILPLLRQLANPSKFLITSRLSLAGQGDVYCHSLSELNENDALAFLRHEAESRGMIGLIEATDEQLQTIYKTVGGNPLALKLVLGQIQFLPLDQVLASLRVASSQRAEQLYSYIYWQAWQMLSQESRHLLLTMPVTPNATFAQLGSASGLEGEALQSALMQLRALSLVEVGGDLGEPRYRLHRLTETFLMHEVVKWQDPNQPETSVEAQFFLQRVLTMVQRWEADEAVQEIEIERLDREYEAILKAISFGLELSEAWTVVKKLVIALTSYMERRGHWAVWHTMLERAIGAAQREDDLDGEITLTALLARLCQRESKPKDVERYYARVIRMARRSGNRFEEARACSNLGYAYIDGGHWWRSEVLSCHALAIFEALGSEHGLAHTHNHLGVLYTRQKWWKEAQKHLQDACSLWDCMKEPYYLVTGHINLGIMYLEKGIFQQSIVYFNIALTHALSSGSNIVIANIYNNIGIAYTRSELPEEAREYLKKSEKIFRKVGDSAKLAQVWHSLGETYKVRQLWTQAIEYFEASLSVYRKLEKLEEQIKTLFNLIECWWALSDTNQVVKSLVDARALTINDDCADKHYRSYMKRLATHNDGLVQFVMTRPSLTNLA